MFEFINKWRESRATAKANKAELELLFEGFLVETEPLVPRGSKYPEVALLRHAWKRAKVLELLFQNCEVNKYPEANDLVKKYNAFSNLASERHSRVAVPNLNGVPRLQMEAKAVEKLMNLERERILTAANERGERSIIRPLACIYIGTCEQGRVYVGQTLGAPEYRWMQHRTSGTGPFKKGERYVQWKVIEGSIDPARLDERESYFIGFHNAVEDGYNETKGNNWHAYDRGVSDSRRLTKRS